MHALIISGSSLAALDIDEDLRTLGASSVTLASSPLRISEVLKGGDPVNLVVADFRWLVPEMALVAIETLDRPTIMIGAEGDEIAPQIESKTAGLHHWTMSQAKKVLVSWGLIDDAPTIAAEPTE